MTSTSTASPLTGLAPGTKVTVYLKVPRDADLDLVVNRPGAPGVQSSAGRQHPGGQHRGRQHRRRQRSARGFAPGALTTRGTRFGRDTAADLAAGSIPAGSIAAGSISANRGAVNEAAQIVTRGETRRCRDRRERLQRRVQQRELRAAGEGDAAADAPACDPVTGLGTAAPGTLPAAVPTTAQDAVPRQPAASRRPVRPDAADDLIGPTSPLNAVAADTRAAASSPVDGDAERPRRLRDLGPNPCSIEAANGVVRSINGSSRPTGRSTRTCKYVVLLGTDTALPIWRQQDLTSPSPEVDEANDLAFTTSGLTKGNAIYAAAAQNTYLTDQAYGAFKERRLARPRHPARGRERLAPRRDAGGHQRAVAAVPRLAGSPDPAERSYYRGRLLRGRRGEGEHSARPQFS